MNKKINQKKRPNGGAGTTVPASSFNNHLSVYDGQEFAGYLLPVGDTSFRAFDSDDCLIGTYSTLRSAMRAIPAKAGAGRA